MLTPEQVKQIAQQCTDATLNQVALVSDVPLSDDAKKALTDYFKEAIADWDKSYLDSAIAAQNGWEVL